MNEDVVKQAITELNASVVALTTKKDNTLIALTPYWLKKIQ